MTTDLATGAARLFTIGFAGRSVDGDLASLLDRGVGGVVLFGRNVGTAEEVAHLTAAIKRTAGRPLPISIDQEGGPVARLRDGFTHVPAMRALGETGDERLAFDVGRLLGRELRAVGIDVDYAPVLDVDTNPENPVIGPRSLGRDPELVARLGSALVRGIQTSGVAACGKHFPGHGDTSQDSHLTLPELPHSLERLQNVELVPFRSAVSAGVASIMTAHVIFSPLDRVFPATMSSEVLAILRESLGFEGVAISDDLEMKAISDHYGIEEAVVRGLNAGLDQFLCCHTAELAHRAIDAVIGAVERGIVPESRLLQANRRQDELVRRCAAPPLERFDASALRPPEHLELAERVLEAGDAETADPGLDPTRGTGKS